MEVWAHKKFSHVVCFIPGQLLRIVAEVQECICLVNKKLSHFVLYAEQWLDAVRKRGLGVYFFC